MLRFLRLALLGYIQGLGWAHAATFYVSSSAGDDAATGASPSAPWRSLSRAGQQRLGLGDELLLHRGDSWIVETGDALVLHNASGRVSSYGNETGMRRTQPLIQVSSRGAWAACVRLFDASSLTVSDLRLAGCGAGVLVSQTLATTRDIAIVRNVFADIRGPMQKFLPAGSSSPQPWVQDWGVAVALAALNTTIGKKATKTLNLTVANNAAVRIDQFYTNTQPGPGWNDGPGTQRMGLHVDGATIRGNTVQACGYNCYEMGDTTHMTVSENVFLRDTPPDMFVYGTTDIILGNVDGTSSIVNNSFNRRGEYEGGPDGCAIDFETSASGVVVDGNTIFKSWGAGIMVFGHQTTSHNLSISNNVFVHDGCIQTRGDRAAIAFTCPNGNRASGKLHNNVFQTCTGKGVVAEAYNEAFPGCTSNWTKVGNLIDDTSAAAQVVAEPRLNVPPTEAAISIIPVTAQSTTPGAIFRYTLDGSRPSEASPLMPTTGVPLYWPGPVVAINFRAFKEGMRPSVTNGVVLELNYPWPDPGRPPPPPARPPCHDGEYRLCGACVPLPDAPHGSGLEPCPVGEKLDFVVVGGNDGSCGCDEYCASNWANQVKSKRPKWTGAASVFGANSTVHKCAASARIGQCVCVQATHWCHPQVSGGPTCGATCNEVGLPTPRDYCTPAQ